MAETQTVPMEEAGMLSSIMADEKPDTVTEVAQPEPQPERTEDRQRDEHGRFVAKQPEPEKAAEPATATPEAPTEQKDDAHVPSWRLREVRLEREEAERRAQEASRQSYAYQQQMAEMQKKLEALQAPKAEPVDFFQDPDGAMNQRLAPVQSDIQQFKNELRLEFSRELAVIKHGEAVVSEVESAVQKAMQAGNPEMSALSVRMRNSSNPVAVAIQWHQQNKLLETTGGNLETYREKVLEEAMKDPKFQARVLEATRTQAAGRPSSIQIPPSLNKATGSGVSSADVDATDMSDRSLFQHAMSSTRR
jgi:hypothetical protein